MPVSVPGGQDARSLVLQQYGSMNTRATRPAIADNEFSWLENMFPIGDGNMRTLYDAASVFYTAPVGRTILHYVPFNIGSQSYIAVFLDNGTAQQVTVPGGVVTNISSVANTFYNASSIPACAQWKSELLVIVGDVTDNGFWLWNGSTLFGAGGLSPDVTVTDGGAAYASAPTVTAYGGSGSGATFTAQVANGQVISITCTNPGSGYLINDQVVLAVSGGGSDNGGAVTCTVNTAIGGVTAVQTTNPGSGYTDDAEVVFTGGGGSGAAAVISSAVNGQVYGITMVNAGTGYTSAPSVSVTGSVGSGWTGQATIVRGQVTGISIAAVGSGYDVPPTVTIVGDGTGATAEMAVTAGALSSSAIVFQGTGYTYAKGILSRANDAALASCTLMPFGINGSTVETYQSRVWVGDGTKASFTAPASTSNFATSAGGGTYPATESFLRRKITRFFQSNGFLYQLGDSSINVISNVQTAGNPPSTTFNNSNVDPQVGTNWPNTVQAFGRAMVFANPLGVYALYGGAAEKVSDALDGLFASADFTTLIPTASVATIFGIRCYCLLFRTTDAFSGTTRNILACWDGSKWFMATQSGITPIQVGTQEIDSIIDTWIATSTTIRKAFQTPSTSLTKYWETKLYPGENDIVNKQALRFYLTAQSKHADGATFVVALNTVSTDNGYVAGANYTMPDTFGLTPKISAAGGDDQLQEYGQLIGWRGATIAKDAVVIKQQLLYQDFSPVV